jgi:hypothetical protein
MAIEHTDIKNYADYVNFSDIAVESAIDHNAMQNADNVLYRQAVAAAQANYRYDMLTADLGLDGAQTTGVGADGYPNAYRFVLGYGTTTPIYPEHSAKNRDGVILVWSPVGYCQFCGVKPGQYHYAGCAHAEQLKQANTPKPPIYQEYDFFAVEREE